MKKSSSNWHVNKIQTCTIEKNRERIVSLRDVDVLIFQSRMINSLTYVFVALESHRLLLCKSHLSEVMLVNYSRLRRLFQSTKINVIDFFQNEGLKHNNSIDLALWKSRKLWCSFVTSDVMLFLRIDSKKKLKSSRASHFRHVFNDDFISRLCRSFMSSLNDERVWRELRNRLDDNAKVDYFRFNILISEKKARIDDIDQMKDLRRYVQLQSSDHDDRVKIAVALLMASFYFELEIILILKTEQYECQDSIRCRNDSKTIIDALIQLLDLHLEFNTDIVILERVSQEDICEACRLYRKRIMIRIRHLDDNVNLYIKFDASDRRKISDFPHSMLWFIQQQQLKSVFDRQNHDLSCRLQCSTCVVQSDSRRKRKSNFSITSRKRLRREW